mgnify:CR=1 FL=1
MDKQNFDTTVNSLFSGMDHVLSSKTVVGEPQVIGDTIILPLVDISFGMGAGAFNKEKGSSAGGGIGGKMSPSAILVIHNGQTKLVNVKNQDGMTKILDMVPDFVNKFTSGKGKDDEELTFEDVDFEKADDDSNKEA